MIRVKFGLVISDFVKYKLYGCIGLIKENKSTRELVDFINSNLQDLLGVNYLILHREFKLSQNGRAVISGIYLEDDLESIKETFDCHIVEVNRGKLKKNKIESPVIPDFKLLNHGTISELRSSVDKLIEDINETIIED
jgi:hypothetical protein